MIKKGRFPRVFFGWWTVLAGGILSLWGFGYYYTGVSALFKPIASELGFSRAATSVAAGIGRMESGFEAPVTGWITDRFGPRWVILFGILLTGLGLVLMNYVDSLWGYFVVWGIIAGTGCNIALSLPLDKAITDWFVKKRGLAISIRWTFSGLSLVGMLPLVAWLITVQGWRTTCVIGGVVMWLIGLPLAWFCFKQHRPEHYGLLPDGAATEAEVEVVDAGQMVARGVEYAAEVEEVEYTLRQAMKTLAYWLLIAAHTGHSIVIQVVAIHCIPFVTDMGIDPVKAAVMMGMTSIGSIPMRFVGGLLGDRVKKQHLRFLMGGAYFLEAAGIIAFLLNQTMAMVYVFFILYYCGFGISLPLNPIMAARYFGRKAFGSIHGTSMMFLAPVSMAAPIYAGWVYDTTGNYITAFIVFAALLVVSVVIIAFALPPKPPARITDVRQFI